MSAGLTVAVVGLGFGAEFVPIYLDHPDVAEVVLCDSRADLLASTAEVLAIKRTASDLETVLRDPSVDAVHLATPIPLHGQQSIAALEAGKHVACAVPAAVDLDELAKIVALQQLTGKNFMMMETAVYTREFLEVKALLDAGEFGRLVFGRGAHHQDMRGWPGYWAGLPPMYYMTHAVSPLLSLFGTRTTSVRCLGAGRLPAEDEQRWGNPYPVETAIFELEGSDAVIEVTRSLYDLMRQGTEAFAIYGDRLGFEWAQQEQREDAIFFSQPEGQPWAIGERRRAKDHLDTLPEQIRHHARVSVTALPGRGHLHSGGGHGGSHPHLVHEFVDSAAQGRLPALDAVWAANVTAAGVAAHASAMRGGQVVEVPSFT